MREAKLKGKRIAIVAADQVEEIELVEPRQAFVNAGAKTELISMEPGEIQGVNHFEPASRHKVDRPVAEADASDYDGLLIPGGVGSADLLRADREIVKFARGFVEQAKPVAVICHGPWVLVEADVVRGRQLTSWPSLETDVRNAGGEWVDREVVVDAGLVTSRKPDDIPAFNEKMIEELAQGKHAGRREKAGAGR
jgi:protease I